MKKNIFLLLALLLIYPKFTLANIGVGIGTGKIQVDQKLMPGTIYELPALTILNTGDEPSEYAVGVSFVENQPELRPSKDWFIFSPDKFFLEPNKAQIVTIKLNLPVNTEPGNYFALVEGFPAKKTVSGNTSVGVAAAAKLYFTVAPANVVLGVYYKAISFWKVYAPWPQRVVGLLAIAVLFYFAKKNLNIKIGLKKPKTNKQERVNPPNDE